MAGWAGKGKQDSAVAVYGGSLVLCAHLLLCLYQKRNCSRAL